MEKYKDIIVVIPSYEPDEQLLNLLATLKNGLDSPIVLINDGSGPDYDLYFEKAKEEFNCTVLKNAVNLGKGRALKNAFNYILNTYPDLIGVVTADSDGQHTVEDIRRCEEMLIESPDNLILGVRDFSGEGIPWKSVFGNNLTRKICKYLVGLNISDTQTGLRGIPREFMKKLFSVSGERFEFETNMLIATKDFCDITEIPIKTIYDSKENHATHFDAVRDSIRIYKIFGKIFLKYIFSSLSSFLIDIVLFSVFSSVLFAWNSLYYVTVATVLARIISSVYNYLVNYSFVFKSKKSKSGSAIKYFILAGLQMCLSAALVTVGVWGLGFLPEIVVKIIVDTVLFLLSYKIQQKFVF